MLSFSHNAGLMQLTLRTVDGDDDVGDDDDDDGDDTQLDVHVWCNCISLSGRLVIRAQQTIIHRSSDDTGNK